MYYSQFQEDEFLNSNIFKNKKNGTYIELGALDGILYSNTKFFEDSLNWKGVLIEPHPEKFKLLEKNRNNNYLFNNLVSCQKEPLVFRYFLDNYSSVSGVENTLSNHHLENYFENNDKMKYVEQNKIIITPITLTEIMNKTNLQHIDLLSLDVEGHEYEVLKSWDFSLPIDVILIEMLGVQPEKDELCRQLLIEKKYKFLMKYNHSEIFIINTFNI